MYSELQYFSTSDLAHLLGVHVSTIKRWTEEGKINCTKTAGGHRKFAFQHISEFLQEHEDKIEQANFLPIESESDLQLSYELMQGNIDFLVDFLFKQALSRDRRQVHKVLKGLYLAQQPLHWIYDNIITPVLHKIGDHWEAKDLSIIEEHFAAQTIRDAIVRLQGLLVLPRKSGHNILCLSLSSELHDIAIKMVDHILEERGFDVLFSGQMTPLYGIETILEKYQIKRLYLSSTYVPDLNRAQFELNYLYDQCANFNTDVIVGGHGFEMLKYDHPAVKARLGTFQEVMKF